MKEKLNVVWIMSDQHGSFASGCYDHPFVKTPNIDHLASEGMLFENAYTSSPVCVPARFSAMSGKYPHSTGCEGSRPLPVDVRTAAHMFSDEGYLTAFIGKMHPVDPQTHGYHFLVDMGHYYDYLGPKTEIFGRGMGAHDSGCGLPWMKSWYKPYSWLDQPLSRDMPSNLDAEDHFEAFVARNCEAFLEEYHSRPFFLFASFIKPHHPFVAPSHYHDLYPPETMELAESALAWSGLPTCASYRLQTDLQDPDAQRRALETMSGYYANVTFMDECVGRILKTLDRLNLAENTLVIYTSDHGEMLFQYGLRGKFLFYDRSAKIPLIMRCPNRIQSGSTSTALTDLTDLLPTSLRLAGIEPDPDLDGCDLSGCLNGSSERVRSACYSELNDRIMIRTDRWKLCRYPEEEWFLFDMHDDPDEANNLYPRNCEMLEIQFLRSQLLDWKYGADQEGVG